MIRFSLRALTAAALLATLVPAAHGSPQALRDAIAAMDAPAMHRATGSEAEKQLAAAIEHGWNAHDGQAAARLAAAAEAQTNPALKAAGLRELMALQMRRGEFAASATSGRAAAALEPPSPGELQALTFVEALSQVGPTRALGDGSGQAPVKRDLAGLMRSDISVGEASVAAILDTGANFSTINATSAERLGLRMLESNVSVGSSSRDAVASRLGVAEKLTIGGADFSNVVFIVLPDKDLSFADGAYTIDAILGMPVFLEMGRIAFTQTGDEAMFSFGPSGWNGPGRNLRMRGMSPMLEGQVTVAGQSRPMMFMLDTGAQRTSLYGRFATDFGDLLKDAAATQAMAGGAGGMVTRDVRRVPNLYLSIGGRPVALANVDMSADGGEDRHGLLGLDALGPNFSIDFDAGVLKVD